MKKIYFLLLFVMLMWGLNVSALKVLVENIDPILLTSFRIFTAGVVVIIISVAMGIFRLPTGKEFTIILYITVFNVIIHHLSLASGIKLTTGVNAGLIIGLNPLLTMVLSILFLKNKVTPLRVIGFVLGFVGVAITTLSSSGEISGISLGDILVFVGILVQAISFILISKYNPAFDPRLLTGYMLIIGSIFIFGLSLILGRQVSEMTSLFDWKLGSVFLFSAILCTACGHMIYNFAIKNVGPAETAIFINLSTFFALLGAVIFLGEKVTFYNIVGLVFILFGVFSGTGALEYILSKNKSNSGKLKVSEVS
ncbi:DMT family transporter [Salirhabdus salicampi]|uniref:DMT family transporter n=1 Tax=Salirhabdus salicampi TaxID=476102 RepID=UPI0020C4EACF|nr:DMT family transporter [Salirhabdus salicampi]MCP8615677.1 DMT family transporter [Salirhabdus salicampi]